MEFKETVGIDISKFVIDATLHVLGVHRVFENNTKGFKALVQWIKRNAPCSLDEILLCFEHTGMYSLPLAAFLSESKIEYVVESALQIKRSLGIARGKNDKVDSKRIAEYAFLRKSSLKTYQLPSKSLQKIQSLLSLRDRLVKQKAGHQAYLKEIKLMMTRKDNLLIFNIPEQTIKQLNTQIQKIEKEIKSIIDADSELNHIYKLVTSVIGIGFIIGVNLLVSTHCFTRFEDGRKFACYSGVAPFDHTSGKSIRGKTRVSHYANKKLKTLFDLAAKTAIQHDPDLKHYYQSRIQNGKSKMSTLNVVRNKLIHRTFAVVKRQTPYIPLCSVKLTA